MGKSQKDMCPFRYWRAREGYSECTDVVNVIKVRRKKDICMGKSQNVTCVHFFGEQEREFQNAQVNFIKVRRQKKKVIFRNASSSVKFALKKK